MTYVNYLSHNDRFSLDAAAADFVWLLLLLSFFSQQSYQESAKVPQSHLFLENLSPGPRLVPETFDNILSLTHTMASYVCI